MSDRDPRYNPIELLINATEADTENAAEWSALYDFQKIAAEWKKERQARDNIIKHSATTAMLQPTTQDHLKLQVQNCNKKIEQLRDQLLQLSQSEALKPVVERTYEKVVEADLIAFRKKQEAEAERKLQAMTEEYQQKRRLAEENRRKQQEQSAQKESVNLPPHNPEKHSKKFFHKLSDIWWGILPILIFVGIPIALCVIIGWEEIPKVISALAEMGGGSWFLGVLLALFAGIGALNICVGITFTIEKIGEKLGKKASLWMSLYLVTTLLGLVALSLLVKKIH